MPIFRKEVQQITVLASPSYCIGIWGVYRTKYSLPDSGYGEWLFFERNVPKFYFVAFDSNGNDDPLIEHASKSGKSIEKFISDLLTMDGFREITAKQVGICLSVDTEKTSPKKLNVTRITGV